VKAGARLDYENVDGATATKVATQRGLDELTFELGFASALAAAPMRREIEELKKELSLVQGELEEMKKG